MSKKSKRVAICLSVDHRDDILMGCRNDNKKWTVPGGHLNAGEDPYEGAIREFKEETGLDVEDIKLVGSHWDKDQNILLYLFTVVPDPKQMIDASKDPDKECDDWHYMNPIDIAEELHVPIERNIALQYWMKS